jgi:hypothetical protein
LNSSSEIIPFLLVIFLMVGVWVIYPYLKLRARRQAWRELARQAGLSFIPGDLLLKGPRVQGTYRGHDLTLETFSQSSGRGSATHTRISVATRNPVDLRLSLNDEGRFDKIGKVLGVQDIQLGDEAMDRRFIIKGMPESRVAALLAGPVLRQQLLETRSLNIEVEGTQVVYELLWVELDSGYLLSLFGLLAGLADQIDQLN